MGAADTAKLIAALELKDGFSGPLSKIGRALDKFDGKIDKTQSKANQFGQHIGLGIKNTAKVIAAATLTVGAAGAALFIQSLGSARDLAETISKVGVVFGAHAERIRAFGKTSASALGLSENAALAAAATYGNLFVSMGLAEKQSADMSLRLVTLAGDLASFNNIDPTEALEKLRAGLTGESEPLKTLGININETIIKAKALELGLVGNASAIVKSSASAAELKLQHIALTEATKEVTAATKKYGADSVQALEATVKQEKAEAKLEGTVKKVPVVLTAAQKAQAAYALILEQSTTAQGDFGRTSEGLANQTRILKANWENLKATLATPALPRIAKIFERINEVVVANQPVIAAFGDKIAGLFSDANIAEGANVIKGVFTTIQSLLPAIQSGAEVTGRVITTAVNAFKSLPPEIQALAVAGLAINKLTGGLVTNIAGGLISAVISSFKGLMNVNAAVVNVNAGTAGAGGLPVTPAGSSGWGNLSALIGPAVALALGLKAVGDITNQEFADKGIKSNFKPPDPGLGGGLITAFHNIGEILRITQNRDLVNNTSADLRTADRHTGELAGALDNTSADLRTADRHIEILTSALDKNTAAAAGVNRPKTQKAWDFALKEVMKPGTGVARGGPDKGSTWSSLLTRNFLRSDSVTYRSSKNLAAAIKELEREQKGSSGKTAADIGRDIATLKTELGRRTAEAANKMKAAVEAAARGIGGAVKSLDVAPKVNVNTSLNSTTFLNGRLISANLERFQTVIQGGSGVLHNGAN